MSFNECMEMHYKIKLDLIVIQRISYLLKLGKKKKICIEIHQNVTIKILFNHYVKLLIIKFFLLF